MLGKGPLVSVHFGRTRIKMYQNIIYITDRGSNNNPFAVWRTRISAHKGSWVHDDVIKWKHFPRNWPFVREIHRSPVNFPAQRPVTRSFDVIFDLSLNKRLSKQPWGWWFETPAWSLWRHRNVTWGITPIGVKRPSRFPEYDITNAHFDNINIFVTSICLISVLEATESCWFNFTGEYQHLCVWSKTTKNTLGETPATAWAKAPMRVFCYLISCPKLALIAVLNIWTNRPLGNVAVILRTYFSNSSYIIVASALAVKLFSCECHWTSLMRIQSWFR